MGTAPLPDNDSLLETDEHYLNEIQLKRSLLENNYAYYFAALPESQAAQWEAVDLVLDNLQRHDPENFSVRRDSQVHFTNKRLDERFSFMMEQDRAVSLAPLDFVGRHVQEDLILLNPAGEVVAGQLCFPSGWALHEKLGKPFLEVHAPLPRVVTPMIEAANKFLERFPVGKSFSRNNWGFRLGNQLDLSSQYSLTYRESLDQELPKMSRESFGEMIFLRVEHQTLTRLRRSNHILFTIHTYHSALQEEASDRRRAQTMLSFLKGAPASLIEYKVMAPFYDSLMVYLSEMI